MAELESTDTDIPQLKIYVQEISDICDEPVDQDKTAETGEIEEIKEPESVEPTSLAELLTYAANTARAGTESKITDVEFAIARLGFDSVKKNIN
jgi:HD-like signal output (HDOD) protein